MSVSVAETEVKYDAPAEVELPDMAGLPAVATTTGPQDYQLRAEYFDTEDLRLIRAGITLRRRTGGNDAGWHLKLPAGPRTRTEIRLPAGRATGQVPAELAGLVRARTHGMALVPVATVTTRRRVITLIGAAGQPLAEVADDFVCGRRTGDRGAAERWREVEVELISGDGRLLAAAGRRLRDAGLVPATRSAKLQRVLGDLPAAGSLRPARLRRSSPASVVVAAYLRTHADALLALDPMVRRDEPDSVHQMRVATRRLRSTLRTFGQVVSREKTGDLADELRWLGQVLGAARDAEVQAVRLLDDAQRTDAGLLLGPVRARLEAHFARARATARSEVLAALNSGRYDALLTALDAVADGPPPGPDARGPAGQVLPAAVRRAGRKTSRRMRRAWRAQRGPARDAALHDARKAAKQARYAAEVVAPIAGTGATRFARRMKKVQAVLGDHQDTVVERELIRLLAIQAHQAGESAFSYGLLFGRGAREARQLEGQARKAWKKAARRGSRNWLRD